MAATPEGERGPNDEKLPLTILFIDSCSLGAGGPSAGQGHASSTVAPTQAQLTKADEAQVMLDVFLRVMEADESEENEKFIDRMNKISGVVHGVQCAVKDMPYLQVVAPILGIASTLFKLFADTRANHGDARALIQEVELVTKGVYGRLYERVEAGYGVTNVDVVKGRLENLKKSLMNTEKTVEVWWSICAAGFSGLGPPKGVLAWLVPAGTLSKSPQCPCSQGRASCMAVR